MDADGDSNPADDNFIQPMWELRKHSLPDL